MKWKPKEGEIFYYICLGIVMVNEEGMYGHSRISITAYNPQSGDALRVKENNCYKTEKEAQAKLRQIKKILKGD